MRTPSKIVLTVVVLPFLVTATVSADSQETECTYGPTQQPGFAFACAQHNYFDEGGDHSECTQVYANHRAVLPNSGATSEQSIGFSTCKRWDDGSWVLFVCWVPPLSAVNELCLPLPGFDGYFIFKAIVDGRDLYDVDRDLVPDILEQPICELRPELFFCPPA